MIRMFDVTADNAELYLRRLHRVPPGPVRVTELADGVSNAVLRVETSAGRFVLKQSRPQLRTQEAWFSDVGRIWRERDAMILLRPLLPPEAVPEILFSDETNFAFAMSHAPEPFRNWRTMLLNGEVDFALGEAAGQLLGAIHENTAGRPIALDSFRDRTVFEQLRVDPFYVRIQERLPDVAGEIALLIERCRSGQLALCHGDFSPKNLLVHAGGFTLVDYETCHYGDATFDLGFFLSHLLLKAIHRWDQRENYFALTQSFWKGYAEIVTFAPITKLMQPGIAHLAGCLLARVDGTSPVPYLIDETKRNAVRRLARRLLRERPTNWDDVLHLCATGV